MNLIVFSLIRNFWEGTPISQDWIDAILVTLFKSKGTKSECDTHCGLTLHEAVVKVLARIILHRMIFPVCPLLILDKQSGFRPGRGTTDMIVSARQLQEKM